jgi:hypothetical protein
MLNAFEQQRVFELKFRERELREILNELENTVSKVIGTFETMYYENEIASANAELLTVQRSRFALEKRE